MSLEYTTIAGSSKSLRCSSHTVKMEKTRAACEAVARGLKMTGTRRPPTCNFQPATCREHSDTAPAWNHWRTGYGLRLRCAVILLLFVSLIAAAQPYVWKSVTIKGGGFVSG